MSSYTYILHRFEIGQTNLGLDRQLLPTCSPAAGEQLIVHIEERQLGPGARTQLARLLLLVTVSGGHLEFDDEREAVVGRALRHRLLGRDERHVDHVTGALVIVRLAADHGQNGRLAEARRSVVQTRDDTRRRVLAAHVLDKVNVDEEALSI